tara:strand:- start:83887 stop:84603 length:717 start_codon:yes stop_codon:yes gene_type:complete
MRVGIIQSCYAPWRGYFDFIASVDLFLVLDDVAYSKGSWRNRNQIKTPRGLQWITVPVSVSSSEGSFPDIDEVRIADGPKLWRNTHRALLKESLGEAPRFQDAIDIWEAGCSDTSGRLSPLNVKLIRGICDYLGITTPIVNARDYPVTGSGTNRVIALLKRAGATCYLSGPAARDYLDEEQFSENSIRLEYKTYDYDPYPQLWGDFVGNVSVLDLIANLGPRASDHIRSKTPDIIATP